MIHSGLLVCSFFVKKRFGRDESNILDLNNRISVKNVDKQKHFSNVWELIDSFLNYNTNPHDDESSMKLFSIERESICKKQTSDYRAVSFIVSSGSYGIEGELTNRTTKNVMYIRTRDDADVKQFHAMIFIPKDKDGIKVQKGIMLFQSIGSYGIKTITTKQMKEYFAAMDLTFETRTVSIALFLRKILQDGNLKKITLLRNAISPDSSDSMLISSGREEKVYIKPKLKEQWIQKLLNYVDGRKDEAVFEINDSIYQDISITFGFAGRSKTARLRDIDRFSIIEDIPDGIYNNGNTNHQKLIRFMLDTAEEYKERMVFRISK